MTSHEGQKWILVFRACRKIGSISLIIKKKYFLNFRLGYPLPSGLPPGMADIPPLQEEGGAEVPRGRGGAPPGGDTGEGPPHAEPGR